MAPWSGAAHRPFQVVLVPLDDRAAVHAGGLHGHQPGELAFGQHEAAHVLAQVARKTLQIARQLEPQLGDVRRQRHAHGVRQFLQSVGGDRLVEPVVVLGEGVDEGGRHAQRLAHVAQRAARAIADDHRRDRRPLAAVLGVDVLDDVFAPVVLEVHVDVGRLVALLADEALEQQLRLAGIDRRDAQAEAHRRIGGGAMALAQDALAAGVANDVVHGEKVHLVPAMRDGFEFCGDLPAHGLRHARRVAALGALLGVPGQGFARGHAVRHGFFRIAVADLVQAELAARRDGERGRQQHGRVDGGQAHAGAQVALGVGLQRKAAVRHGPPQPHGRDHVLQALAATHVHVHIARGDERQAQRIAHLLQRGQPQAVIGGQGLLHRQPGGNAQSTE